MRAGENTGDLDRPCGSKICRRAELGLGGQRLVTGHFRRRRRGRERGDACIRQMPSTSVARPRPAFDWRRSAETLMWRAACSASPTSSRARPPKLIATSSPCRAPRSGRAPTPPEIRPPPDPPDSTKTDRRARPRSPPLAARSLAAQFGLVAGRPASRQRQGRRIHALLTVPTEAANARCRLAFFAADYRFGAGLSLRCGLHATTPAFHNWAILKGGLPGLMRQWG